MRSLILSTGGALLFVASAASAQSMPAGHSQHHATKHSSSMSRHRCCCEHDMHEMMSMMHQMMKMHEGMNVPKDDGMKTPMQPAAPGQNPPPPDQHQH